MIYLALDACAKFESAFGLVRNATDEIFTLNDTAHATLKSTNQASHSRFPILRVKC